MKIIKGRIDSVNIRTEKKYFGIIIRDGSLILIAKFSRSHLLHSSRYGTFLANPLDWSELKGASMPHTDNDHQTYGEM